MADDSLLTLSRTLIAGRYAVDTSEVLADAGGGLPAYLARDRMASDGRRVALAVSRNASPRARHLTLLDEPIDNLMSPLGHGVAPLAGGKGAGYFVVCTPAPGQPVAGMLSPWSEKALIDLVLRPIAGVLEVLQSRNLTHRAIRPNNVFYSGRGQPVTLGAAWAAPPAMHQPCAFESPYSAMCVPAGRGDGSIADDVYALGVLLLTLSAGRMPMANMDDETIIRWKLDLGSFAALTRNIPLSGSMSDLLYATLVEDPDHRAQPSMLMDPASIRGRRTAARPGRRSQNPLLLNEFAAFDSRTLAYGLFLDEKKGIQLLRSGQVTQWLRRGLGDASLATQIEDLVRGRMTDANTGTRNDPLLVMRTISAINPLMPLCWRGIALWPDALAQILAEGIAVNTELWTVGEELLVGDVVALWSETKTRLGRPDTLDMFAERQYLQNSGASGLLRLYYRLNPFLPCRASVMSTVWIANMSDLMEFFERAAEKPSESLIDLPISAFIAARADRKTEMQVNALVGARDGEAFRLAELDLLRDLQARYYPQPMPALANWVAARLRPNLARWHNKSKREALQSRLDALAQGGMVARLLELAEDRAAWAQDSVGAQLAASEMAMIDAEIAAIDNNANVRFIDAERYGRAIAGGIGLSAFILMVMSVLLG